MWHGVMRKVTVETNCATFKAITAKNSLISPLYTVCSKSSVFAPDDLKPLLWKIIDNPFWPVFPCVDVTLLICECKLLWTCSLYTIQWMRARWTSDPCYAFYGVDGSDCSFLIYLSEVEWFCPPLSWRNHSSPPTQHTQQAKAPKRQVRGVLTNMHRDNRRQLNKMLQWACCQLIVNGSDYACAYFINFMTTLK